MTSVKLSDDPVATGGLTWDVSFNIAKVGHRFSRRVGPNGAVISEGATANGQALTGVTVKADGNAIIWTVPRANVPKLKGRGALFTTFYAGTSSPTLTYDQAPDGGRASEARYVDRTPSCVRPA
jgi:hypothetical protein